MQPNEQLLPRVACYLSFLEHARCPVRGFHNFLSYQRDWLDAAGTGDCQGQAVLAIAEVLGSSLPEGFRSLARELLETSLPAMTNLRSLRAQAYVIQAWAHLWRAKVEHIDEMEQIARRAADRLVECYERSQRSDWHWFESYMTYANAVLPHAMFAAAERWPEEAYGSIAESSFGFLDLVTTTDEIFWPVGNHDWYSRGEVKSLYAQQPVEASTMAAAAVAGLRFSDNHRYLEVFDRAYQWFMGANSMKSPLANKLEGSCCDGIESTGINRNQGAESTLAYLWSELLKVQVDQMRSQPRIHKLSVTTIGIG
jgi:hypothetical protein